LQSLNSLASKLLGFYHHYKKSFLVYYRFYKEPILIIIFILATIVGVGYTQHNDPNNDLLNIAAALGVSVAIILTLNFIEEIDKKDPLLTVLSMPPLVVFVYVGLVSDIWTAEVIKALTGVIATFLGFFGIFAGYTLSTYNERDGKNNEIKNAITDQMDTIKGEKSKTLRYIVGIFWCICLSLLLSFISLNYLDLVQSGTETLTEISGGHPYRFLFFFSSILVLWDDRHTLFNITTWESTKKHGVKTE